MAASPQWKVYNPSGEYVACCKHIEDAACLVALYGDGATIRNPWSGHSKAFWREGAEAFFAGESYDRVCEIVSARYDNKMTAP